MADRIEPCYLVSAGMALTAFGLAGFAMISPQTPLVLMAAKLALFGCAIFSFPNMGAIMGSVRRRHYEIAAGAVATLVLSVYQGNSSIEPAPFLLFLNSMKTVMSLFSAMCFVGIYFSIHRGKNLE
jgi:hypothetical protein